MLEHKYQIFPIVEAVHNQRTEQAMTSLCMRLCSKTVKKEVVLCSVIEHDMTAFRFQTAQKNSASLCSSIQQFKNSNDVNSIDLNYNLSLQYQAFLAL